jgi:hypothetical protein
VEIVTFAYLRKNYGRDFSKIQENSRGCVCSHIIKIQWELKTAMPGGMGTPHHRLPCRNLKVIVLVGTFLSAFGTSAIGLVERVHRLRYLFIGVPWKRTFSSFV